MKTNTKTKTDNKYWLVLVALLLGVFSLKIINPLYAALPISSPVSEPVSDPISSPSDDDADETSDNDDTDEAGDNDDTDETSDGDNADETGSSTALGGDSSSGSSSPRPAGCTSTQPGFAPVLFEVDATPTSATLNFVPVINFTDRYFIAYGYQTGVVQFGDEFLENVTPGVMTRTIYDLAPETHYSFMVRAGNDCMPGDWSNWLEITTPSQGEIKYYLF